MIQKATTQAVLFLRLTQAFDFERLVQLGNSRSDFLQGLIPKRFRH